MTKSKLAGLLLSLVCASAQANIVVNVQSLTTAPNQPITYTGTITLQDTKFGLLIIPAVKSLSPGMHGFHLHENPSCADNGNGAGGHFDPHATQEHKGPFDNTGHKGDLPALFADTYGMASVPTIAPRLTEKDLMGHALIIHSGPDNYSDNPLKLGGGGARVACGVIPNQSQ